MEWDPKVKEMLNKVVETVVPKFVRAIAKKDTMHRCEKHAIERNSQIVEEVDLIVVAYKVTPQDKLDVMENAYRSMGVDIDMYKSRGLI